MNIWVGLNHARIKEANFRYFVIFTLKKLEFPQLRVKVHKTVIFNPINLNFNHAKLKFQQMGLKCFNFWIRNMELLINLFLLDITSRIFIELINQCSICNVINIICIPENQPRKSQAVERVSYFEAGNSTLLIVTSTESLHWHWSPLLLLPFIVCSIKSKYIKMAQWKTKP